jgi:hypothetical protein
VSKITLNRALTGGRDGDDAPGDDMLRVVLEPRSTSGAIVDVPGDVSVVVLDPALDGTAARVARWDFTAEHTAELLRQSPAGKGLQLDLQWPDQPPANRALMLFVRYATPDGAKHVADQQIEITPPGSQPTDGPRVLAEPTAPGRFFTPAESAQPLSAAPRVKSDDTAAMQPEPPPAAQKQAPAKQAAKPQRPQWTPYR